VLRRRGGWQAGGGSDGFAVTPELEIFSTREEFPEIPELKKNPCVAWVIGARRKYRCNMKELRWSWRGELEKYKRSMRRSIRQHGRDKWADLTYFVVRPTWVRYGDYTPGKGGSRRRSFEK